MKALILLAALSTALAAPAEPAFPAYFTTTVIVEEYEHNRTDQWGANYQRGLFQEGRLRAQKWESFLTDSAKNETWFLVQDSFGGKIDFCVDAFKYDPPLRRNYLTNATWRGAVSWDGLRADRWDGFIQNPLGREDPVAIYVSASNAELPFEWRFNPHLRISPRFIFANFTTRAPTVTIPTECRK